MRANKHMANFDLFIDSRQTVRQSGTVLPESGIYTTEAYMWNQQRWPVRIFTHDDRDAVYGLG